MSQLKASNNSHSNRAVIFVFYKANSNKGWIYKNIFPEGWSWTGGGYTSNVAGTTPNKNYTLYPQEEQFNGSIESRTSMRAILDDFLKNLKNNGVIVRYKIRYSYKP